MKKFWTGIALLFIMLCVGVVVGCDENRTLSSISISIDQQYATSSEGSGAVPTYNVQLSNKKIPLRITLTPSSFNVRDLKLYSSAENVCYITADGYLVTKAGGSATLRLYYKNSDGRTISSSFKINVLTTPVPKFSQTSVTLNYNGANQIDNEIFKVLNEDEEVYAYSYYYKSPTELKSTSEIKDAGEYIIKYHKKDNDTFVVCQLSVVVNKATLSISAQNLTSIYYEDITELDGFYYSNAISDVTSYDYDIISNVGEDNDKKIGEYSFVSFATKESYVGEYDVGVEYKLYDEYAENYNISVTKAKHRIDKLSLILAVNDQTRTYGDELVKNEFTLYPSEVWKEPFNPSPSSELDDEVQTYLLTRGDLSMKNYTIKNADGSKINKNQYGNYDVLDSGFIDIERQDLIISSNIEIYKIIKGEITINKKELTVSIVGSASKRHLESDNISSLTLSFGDDEKFARELSAGNIIQIDYGENAIDYGENGELAPAKEYDYELKDNISGNFDITLSNDYEPYVINAAEVIVQFDSLKDVYKKSGFNISYYDDEATYKINLKYLSVNGTIYHLDDKDNEGYFSVKLASGVTSEEKIGFNLEMNNETTSLPVDVFEQYSIKPKLLCGDTSYSSSFSLQDFTFYLSLTKQTAYYYLKNAGKATYSYYSDEPTTTEFFANSNIVVEDADGNELDIGDILKEPNKLFSLQFSDKKYHFVADGKERQSSHPGNAGIYEVDAKHIDSDDYKAEYKYLDLQFKFSSCANFTINKLAVVVTPKENMGKIYGSADGVINFDTDMVDPKEVIETLAGNTGLSRVAGENVGTYQITKGNLSFTTVIPEDGELFNNYELTVNTEGKVFTISQRNMYIKANDTIITYGQKYPLRRPITSSDYQIYIKDDKENIVSLKSLNMKDYPNLAIPQATDFSGIFKLSKDGTTVADNVNDIYNVLYDDGGKIKSYNIILDTSSVDGFHYLGSNYMLNSHSEYGTCKINPKEAVVSFNPTGISSTEGIEKDGDNYLLEFNSEEHSSIYSISGLLSNITKTNIVVKAQMNSNNSLLYVNSIGDITPLKVLDEDDADFASNYRFKLSNKNIYNIASELITVQLQSSGNNTLTTTYNGQSQKDSFTLVSLSDKYEVLTTSKYRIIYKNSDGEEVDPTDVGSYTVSVDLEEDDMIVIKKGTENIFFESFDTRNNGYILNFAGFSSLNIEKATVTYDKIEFEEDFVYNSSKAELPKIKLKDNDDKPYFKGVDGKGLALAFTTDGLNYEVVGQLLSLITTGEYADSKSISLHLQVARFYDGDDLVEIDDLITMNKEEIASLTQVIDANYNPIDIPEINIDIIQRVITIKDHYLNVNNTKIENYKYSCDYTGNRISTQIEIEDPEGEKIDKIICSINSSVRSLEFEHDQEKIKLKYYKYENNAVDESIENTISAESVELTGEEEIKIINGNSYLIIGDKAIKVKDNTVDALTGSGAWIVKYAVGAKNGYTFRKTGSDEDYEIEEYCLVSIDKNKDYLSGIIRNNDNISFYYGTAINVEDKKDIRDNKFGIVVPHRFADMLEFEISGSTGTTILPIGQYKLVCTINDDNNYYLRKEIKFEIVRCRVEIGLPHTSSYIYTGSEISDFLQEITVSYYDCNDEIEYVKSYSEIDENDLSFSYIDLDTSSWSQEQKFAIKTTPYGEYYKIGFTYIDEEHTTDRTFEYKYRIEPRPYTESIDRYPTYMEYDPNIEYSTLYQRLLNNIKVSNLSNAVEKVVIFYGDLLSQDDEEGATCLTLADDLDAEELERQENELLEIVMKVGQSPITYKVVFEDDSIGSQYRSTNLNISRKAITDSTFSFVTNSSNVYYTGHPQYQGIKFANIDLSPNNTQTTNGYMLETDTSEATQGKYSVTLKDRFNHVVLTVIYTYTKNGSPVQSPIEPNDEKYKVSYIIESGGDYTITKQFEEREYKILKASKINFNVTVNDDNLIYVEDNILLPKYKYIDFDYNKFISEENFIQVTGKNEYNQDVKFRLVKQTSSTYSPTWGVSLTIIFKSADNLDGPALTEIKQSGDYVAYICIDKSSAYNPENHFEKIEFNNSNIVVNSSDLKTSDYLCMIEFTLQKRDIGLNEDSIDDFVGIVTTDDENYGLHNYTTNGGSVKKAFYVESGVKFEVKDPTKYDISVYYYTNGIAGNVVSDYDTKGFAEVSVEACYMPFIVRVEPKDSNCYSSYDILVIVHFNNDNYVKDYINNGNTLAQYNYEYNSFVINIDRTELLRVKSSSYALKAYYFTNNSLGEEVADFASKGFTELDEHGDKVFKVALVSTIEGVNSVNYIFAIVHFPPEE